MQGFFFFFPLPAQIKSEPVPKGLVVSVQLLPLGRDGGRIPGDQSI